MSDELILKIVVGAIILLAAIPSIAWRIHLRLRFSKAVSDSVSKPFVCPRCGFRFFTKQKFIYFIGKDKAFLKCPSCGKRHVCGRPYDID